MAIRKETSGSAAPAAPIAVNDRIAQRLAEHAQVIHAYLVQPRLAFDETWPASTMPEEVQHEIVAALVFVDVAFAQPAQDHAQTAWQ
jgi:hypothetical protein